MSLNADDDAAHVYLNSPIDYKCEDAVCNLWTVLCHTKQVPDICDLGHLILSLMREVAGK